MRIIVEKNVMVPMSDGVALATDVYRPDESGPFPTLVRRTPYDKEDLREFTEPGIMDAVQAGYAVMVQDTRGCGASEGTFHPFASEARDGAETIAWAAGQSWSTGMIGTIGDSYLGMTQWHAATEAPAALKAMAPSLAVADYYHGWVYQGGAFSLGFNLIWALHHLAPAEIRRRQTRGAATADDLDALVDAIDATAELYNHLPLTDLPELDEAAPYYREWLAHPSYDAYWHSLSPRERIGAVGVPAFHVAGWYDLFLGGTLSGYRSLRERGGTAMARASQRLLIGSWTHGALDGAYPEHRFGLRAGFHAVDGAAMQVRWFDHWLKGIPNGVNHEPPVRLFVMGSNVWRDEDDWPLPDTSYQPYYLHSGGHANSARGDGLLSPEPPADEPPDVYRYDPLDPVPTMGGATFLPGLTFSANTGPRDQQVVEARPDVLCYTTPPLREPLEVTGPVELVLYISSSTPDTDFTGKLVDVAPDGRAMILTDGILRARYRDSFAEPALLRPGRVYALRIDLGATANVFQVGHRLRLEVSSSNFPRFDRNTNTGGTIAAEGREALRVAVNHVHHDRTHRSHLLLPTIARQ